MGSRRPALVPARPGNQPRRRWAVRLLILGGPLLAIAGLWLTSRTSLAVQLSLACAVSIGVALTVFLNWRRLLGPVFVYDVVRTARMGRGFGHRFLYGCLLLTIAVLVFWSWTPGNFSESFFKDVQLTRKDAERFAWSFFISFLAVQFAGVLFITPAYTAGAIAQEKERRTLEFLLVTELSNREIVVGILAARLANLFLILLTGLPVLCLLPLLGGVDPGLILAGFFATVMTGLSVGGLSILVSVHAARPLSAVLMTYLWLALIMSASACLPLVNYSHPVISLVYLGRTLDTGGNLTVTLIVIVLAYFVFHGLATVACCWWATKALREVYLGSVGQPASVATAEPAPVLEAVAAAKKRALRLPVEEIGGWGPFPRDESLTMLPADASPAQRPPPVVLVDDETVVARLSAHAHRRSYWHASIGEDGLLWKEALTNHNWLRGLYTLCRPGPAVALGGAFVVLLAMRLAVDRSDPGEGLGAAVNPMVRGLGTVVFCAGLLVAALNAAGRVTREREQNTLDSLRTTPLDSSEILFTKWLASVWSVRGLAWFFLIVWGFGVMTGGLHVAALPFLLGVAAAYYSCLAMVGLWFSTVYRNSLRATLFTVLAALVLVTGPGLLARAFFDPSVPTNSAADWDERLVTHMLSPPVTVWSLSFQSGDLLTGKQRLPMLDVIAAVLGVHFYLALTGVLWWSMLRRFDADKGPPPQLTGGR